MKLVNTHIDVPEYMEEKYFDQIVEEIENSPFGDLSSLDLELINDLLYWEDDPINPDFWLDIYTNGIGSVEQYIEFIGRFGFVMGPVRDIEDMM